MRKPDCVLMYGDGSNTVRFDGVEKVITDSELTHLRSIKPLDDRIEAGRKLWQSKPPIRTSEYGASCSAKCGKPPHRGFL